MVLFGAASLLHLLVVSVSRRRRQFALLKVLGFLRRQVRAAMCGQAATVAVIGVVGGVPIGLVVGVTVWDDFATNLGAVPLAVTPAIVVVVLAVATIAGAVLLALVPATLAGRVRPGEALREA
jgi:ABC-type antimicrobial peptide transport system permease subunit